MIHYIQCGNLEASKIDDEWIILNSNDFTITKLNGVGGFCWSLLQEKQSVDTIIDAVQACFDGSENISKLEIEEYLVDLRKYGLIQHAN